MGIKVYVKDQPLGIALKKLKKISEKEGLVKEMKRKQFYEKKSDRERRERLRAKKAAQRASQDNNAKF